MLEAAIVLSQGDRGILLSHEDADDDGKLDVVLSRGFDHDPRDSAVAQRFAREVLKRDQILREDAPAKHGEQSTAADREIESLVAIPLYLHDRFHGVVICANRPGGFEDVEDAVLLALGDHAGAALQQGMLHHQLESAHRGALRTLVEAVSAFDPLLHRESARLVVHALHLAADLGLDTRERDVLVGAVLLRAVGYLALPDSVLRKPGPLTDEERQVVEMHPRIGFNIIGQVPALREVATGVLHHQERFDGTGYPAGLAGDRIPLVSRALGVLESYGAMTHERPFRCSRSAEDACQDIIDGAGSQFDPEIAQLFVEEIRHSAGDPSDDLAESVLEVLPYHPGGGIPGMLGPFGGPSTDGLTLLGDHRALQLSAREAIRLAGDDGELAVAFVQLEDLPRLNDEASFMVGDRLIQVAARNLTRAAARLGGTAFRASGRRLAMIVPLGGPLSPEHVEQEIAGEFTGGPAIRHTVVTWNPGERSEDLIARARHQLAAPAAGT
ncbi:hypothetical protein DSM104329_05283 [Capillimicrobium parvum]|uniref:GAF domain-containing protein n=1 Tax=Capillimicrobium parvum TaxID=2884022 RepID=A0A9E6Y2S6_9ACTN|nr:hypothetical protein DSM104329_05283 [Capillimicrobium parvum]